MDHTTRSITACHYDRDANELYLTLKAPHVAPTLQVGDTVRVKPAYRYRQLGDTPEGTAYIDAIVYRDTRHEAVAVQVRFTAAEDSWQTMKDIHQRFQK